MAAVPSNQPLLQLWAVEDRPAASHIPNPAASRVCSQVNPCVQGMRRSLGSLPCRAAGMSWHVRGLGQGRNAALLAQWLSQPPTLAGGAEDQRIPGSCWISPKVEQGGAGGAAGGSWGAGTGCPRGDNPVAPEAPAGAATRCSGGAEGLPGLGPLGVVSWLPNSRCVSLEGKDGSWLLAGGSSGPSIPHFLPACGRSWDCPAPAPVLLSRGNPGAPRRGDVAGGVLMPAVGWWHGATSVAGAPPLPGQASLPSVASPPVPAFPALPAAPAVIPCPLPCPRIYPRVGGPGGWMAPGGWPRLTPVSLFSSSAPGCPPGAGCPWPGCRWDPREPPPTEQRPR